MSPFGRLCSVAVLLTCAAVTLGVPRVNREVQPEFVEQLALNDEASPRGLVMPRALVLLCPALVMRLVLLVRRGLPMGLPVMSRPRRAQQNPHPHTVRPAGARDYRADPDQPCVAAEVEAPQRVPVNLAGARRGHRAK